MIRLVIVAAIMLTLAPAAFAQPRNEQRPDSFVDAASVAPGLIVEARYATRAQFRRPADRRLRQADLLSDQAGGRGAGAGGGRSRAARADHQGVRLLSAGAGGGAFRALGAQPRRREDEGRVLSAGRQEHAVPGRLYRGALRPFARLDRGPDAWRAAPTARSSTWARRSISSARAHGRPTGASSAEAQANRALLAQAMRRRGFRPYDKEWWHFTLRHEPYPETYFDFPVRLTSAATKTESPASGPGTSGRPSAAFGVDLCHVAREQFAMRNGGSSRAVPKKVGGIDAPQRLLGISVG